MTPDNAATWNKRDLPSAAERFDYDYSEKELTHFIPRLREMAAGAAAVHVVFNVNTKRIKAFGAHG